MLKVLVVDDEVLERKALIKIIRNASEQVMVIGEGAKNGRAAIEMAREYEPDIIFMDIKMPGIDGVQAVKEIKQFAPDTRFIMVSAFNTFEYAKEVMQQGVKEYILKPSRKQDILESLGRVSAEIIRERKQREEQKSLKESLNRAVSIAQKEWVSSLIMNRAHALTFDEWSELFGVEITSGFMMLFYFEPKTEEGFSPAEKQHFYSWLKNALKTTGKKQEVLIGPMTDTQVPVLFLCKGKYQFKTDARAIIDSLYTLFQKELNKGELKISVGLPYHYANELHQSYHDAIMALKQLLAIPDRKFLICDKRGSAKAPPLSGMLEVEKQLLEAVRQGDLNQVLLKYESYIQMLSEKPLMKKSFDELFVLISRMLHDLGIQDQQAPVIDESIGTYELLEKGKAHLLEVVIQVQSWRNNHAKGMLYKAKEYIETHYADSLTLEEVAEYVELSPFYFSKLFKDRFGVTFIDYLTEIRIKQAKLEMEDQGRSLKEICFSVGYKDPNYFSRVFKKHTGLSPTEFRKKIVS